MTHWYLVPVCRSHKKSFWLSQNESGAPWGAPLAIPIQLFCYSGFTEA